MILSLLRKLMKGLARLFSPPADPSPSAPPQPTQQRAGRTQHKYTRIHFEKFNGVTSEPPPLHWAPCHPATMRRFKASLTCPYGHSLTLKGHSISADGVVSPSVVCPVSNCSFHEFVILRGWDHGHIS